ncbi:MAG: xanthine dehydrogenase subunit D [Candidatus Hydrogenedentota bacterium]|nr:xanthine dehydrogenase family protein molybdopterin-binding subunit [Candidatus Sumerlaea chitinivorans]RMH24271.1 MAG: xanthine dehydrogenase subunit D [Candidatus Hydrogenedentota bacterium]
MAAVGKPLIRFDAREKVTGETRYGGDLYEKGMLHVKVLRSEYAHAEILSVDPSAALALPGVVGVYTARDISGTNRHGLIRRDQTVLAEQFVRYKGDAIAIVVAESDKIAREALKLIKVEYRPLPVIHTIDEALAPDAPKIHPEGNVMGDKRIRKGDAERAFAEECDVIVEETFSTQTVDHAFLDLEAGSALYDGEMLTIWVSGQWVHEERRLVALALGLPVERVRIIQPATGGAFGGREDLSIQCYVGLAALKHPNRKVYLRYSRAESMTARHKRHAMRIHYTLGAKRDGTLVAAKVTVWSDEGAYHSTGLAVMRKASSHSTGVYRVPNIHVDVYGVFTNNNPTGAMRGFGAAQMAICYEGMLDRLAAKLGMDRIEIRRKNVLRHGDEITTSQVLPVVTAEECLDAALMQFARGVGVDVATPQEAQRVWDARSYATPAPYLRRGYGVSIVCFGLGYGDAFPDAARAEVRFNDQNELEVYTGAVEVGQGLLMMVKQVAASVLGIEVERVKVIAADTHRTPEAGSSSATRQTYFTGSAVKMACEELKETILDVAETHFGVHPFEIRIEDGILYNVNDRSKQMPLDEVLAEARRRGVGLSARALFKPRTIRESEDTGLSPRPFITYLFGSHISQVLVDTETGEVKIERHIAAHDVGKAINPQLVEGQIQGGVAQGIGMALMEEVIYGEDGRILNAGFTDYILPSIRDVPQIEAVIVEHDDPSGPFGAHGIGEPPLVGTTPAILSAIADAIGVLVNQTPATPERVWRLIQQARERGEWREVDPRWHPATESGDSAPTCQPLATS